MKLYLLKTFFSSPDYYFFLEFIPTFKIIQFILYFSLITILSLKKIIHYTELCFWELILKKNKIFLFVDFQKDENISSPFHMRTLNERRKISQLENSGCALRAL